MTAQPQATNAPQELGKPLNPGVQITRLRYSSDGRTLAAACFDGKVRRWDVTGKEPVELPAIPGHNGWVTTVAFGDGLRIDPRNEAIGPLKPAF